MKQAFPDISPEVKERLHSEGIVPFQYPPIPVFTNPHKPQYWATNALIAGIALVGRHYSGKKQSIRILWSAVICSIPLFAISTNVRLDSLRSLGQHRKTLEERLDFYPMTRRAWERAVKDNTEYQNQLKDEIQELEYRLNRK